MNFWYALSGVVALIILLPHIRCFFKRIICKTKIEKLCKTKGYRIYKTHPFWFFGSNSSKKCDIYIESATKVFAVKLFAIRKKHSVLVFKENGEYFIRKFIAAAPFGSMLSLPIDGRAKVLPTYNFRYNYKDKWEIKTPVRVLLLNPVSIEVRIQSSDRKETIIGAREIANGMQINSLQHFLEDLGNAV